MAIRYSELSVRLIQICDDSNLAGDGVAGRRTLRRRSVVGMGKGVSSSPFLDGIYFGLFSIREWMALNTLWTAPVEFRMTC